MNAVRARRKRHVETIVDEDSGPRAAHSLDARGDETCQRAAVEVALTNLNEVNACTRRSPHAFDERDLPGWSETPPVGDQTNHGLHFSTFPPLNFSTQPRNPWSGAASVSVLRASRIEMSSPSPDMRLITP